MTKLIIVSDTHSNKNALLKMQNLFRSADLIIHLGDGTADIFCLDEEIINKTVAVNGNCDIFKNNENERVIRVEDINLFMTHGHLYSAKMSLSRIAGRAKELNCQIALYGHTHSRKIENIDGVTLINPGSLSRSQEPKSFCVLTVDKSVSTPYINERFFD